MKPRIIILSHIAVQPVEKSLPRERPDAGFLELEACRGIEPPAHIPIGVSKNNHLKASTRAVVTHGEQLNLLLL